MNNFFSFIKNIFKFKNKNGLPELEIEEKDSSILDDIKVTPSPACIKHNIKVFNENGKNFICEDTIYNNGDIYSTRLGDGSTDHLFPHFAFSNSYKNNNKCLRKIVDFRYHNSDEYFSGTQPYRIILTQNASEEDMRVLDERYWLDMHLKEFHFEKQNDGKYLLIVTFIKSCPKINSQDYAIKVDGFDSPTYSVGATVQQDGNNEVFTYEQIIKIINNLNMPHKLPENFESIIQGGYKVPEVTEKNHVKD